MKKYFVASVLILLFSTTFALTIHNKTGVSQYAKLSLRDGGFSRGRTAILPLECKREFTSRAASMTGRSSHEVRNSCKNPIHVTIADFGQTPSDYHYCLEVYVGYDLESGCGVPVRLGPDFINGYLIGIDGNPSYYIKFAYSKAQPNAYWPSDDSKTCQFPLNSNATLTVNIEKDGCTITQLH